MINFAKEIYWAVNWSLAVHHNLNGNTKKARRHISRVKEVIESKTLPKILSASIKLKEDRLPEAHADFVKLIDEIETDQLKEPDRNYLHFYCRVWIAIFDGDDPKPHIRQALNCNMDRIIWRALPLAE